MLPPAVPNRAGVVTYRYMMYLLLVLVFHRVLIWDQFLFMILLGNMIRKNYVHLNYYTADTLLYSSMKSEETQSVTEAASLSYQH